MKVRKRLKKVTIWEFETQKDYTRLLNWLFDKNSSIKKQLNKNKVINGDSGKSKNGKIQRTETYYLEKG